MVESYSSNLLNKEILALEEKWDLEVGYLYIPDSSRRVNNPEEGRCVLNPFIVKASGALPLSPYFVKILNYFKIALIQVAPNGWSILSSLRILYHKLGFKGPSAWEISYMYNIKQLPVKKNGLLTNGYYHLSAWSKPKYNLIEDFTLNVGDSKDYFFIANNVNVQFTAYNTPNMSSSLSVFTYFTFIIFS